MPWPIPGASSNCNPAAAITESTSIDMAVLTGPNMQNSAGEGVVQFLKNQTSPTGGINVCVTGHSLGGALASTLALYLLENQSVWDQSTNSQSTVSAICFAAPSAGNNYFAENSNTVFANAAAHGSRRACGSHLPLPPRHTPAP